MSWFSKAGEPGPDTILSSWRKEPSQRAAQFTREEGVDSFGHKTLGGIGEFLAEEIQSGTELETRCCPEPSAAGWSSMCL